MLTENQKTAIKEHLNVFVMRNESQQKASVKLGVSAATLTQVLNNNWELINDRMWNKIAAGIGMREAGWNIVSTHNTKIVTSFLLDAKTHANVHGIIGEPGSSKSESCKQFVANTKNSYWIGCSEFWNRKKFLSEIMKTMGIDNSGYTTAEMMDVIINQLKSVEKPVLLIDEADKLTDHVLYFFITLYNQLEGYCGIVLLATDFLKKRIEHGVRYNKKGYKEIYSRLGKRFISCVRAGEKDIRAICIANGVEDEAALLKIVTDCDADFRRVKKRVRAYHNKQADKNKKNDNQQ